MSTDRELLELAAKACGIGPVIGFAAEACELMIGPRNHMRYWRPLTDDGDALRLAVKLRMRISVGDAGSMAYWETPDPICGPTEYHFDGRRTDEQSTRRAIVRAAAAIGESMP